MLYHSDLKDIYETPISIKKAFDFLGDPNNPTNQKYAIIEANKGDIRRILAKVDREFRSQKGA